MPRDDLVELNGKIGKALGGGKYEVLPEGGGTSLTAQLCGKMKQNHIRVLPGDRVTVGVSPYDLTHGIITFRFR